MRARTLRIAIATVGLMTSLLATPVTAVTVDGKWGIGFEETLTGVTDVEDEDGTRIWLPASGIALHRYLGGWDLEAVVGAKARFAFDGPTRWAGFLALGAHKFAFRSPRANLSVGARVVAGIYRDVDFVTGKTKDPIVGFTFELPLRALFFLSDHFAISGAVGPVAAFEPAEGNPLTGGSDAVKVHLFKGGFSGGLGFTFLFD